MTTAGGLRAAASAGLLAGALASVAPACDDWERLSANHEVNAATEAGPSPSPSPSSSIDGGEACGPPRACPPGAYLCNAFELAGVEGPSWRPAVQAASITADPAPVCKGARSLHVHTEETTPPATTRAFLTHVFTDARVRSHLHGRAFVYFQRPRNVDFTIRLVQFAADSDKQVALRVVGGELDVRNDFAASDPPSSGVPIAFDRWVCFSWEIAVARSGVLRLRYDDGSGAERLLLESTFTEAPLPAALPERLGIGIGQGSSAGQPPLDVWFDDVVLDDEPVDCAR